MLEVLQVEGLEVVVRRDENGLRNEVVFILAFDKGQVFVLFLRRLGVSDELDVVAETFAVRLGEKHGSVSVVRSDSNLVCVVVKEVYEVVSLLISNYDCWVSASDVARDAQFALDVRAAPNGADVVVPVAVTPSLVQLVSLFLPVVVTWACFLHAEVHVLSNSVFELVTTAAVSCRSVDVWSGVDSQVAKRIALNQVLDVLNVEVVILEIRSLSLRVVPNVVRVVRVCAFIQMRTVMIQSCELDSRGSAHG